MEGLKAQKMRGIRRDEDGKIVFTPKQKKERMAHFTAKIDMFKERIKKAKEEIKKLSK